METFTIANGLGGTYTFEVVTAIPEGYRIWNIPEMCEYIPLCKLYRGTYKVQTDCLKAIKVADAHERAILRKGAHYGSDTVDGARRVLADKRRRQGGRAQQLATLALPILERLTEAV